MSPLNASDRWVAISAIGEVSEPLRFVNALYELPVQNRAYPQMLFASAKYPKERWLLAGREQRAARNKESPCSGPNLWSVPDFLPFLPIKPER